MNLRKRDLGVPPDERTRELHHLIRDGKIVPNPAPNRHPKVAPPHCAERKQVTALFCGIGVTPEADPEEAGDILRQTQERCAEIIRSLDGHIVQTYGGAILAYFGYPLAQEDAARRAVRAALAMLSEARNSLLTARIGIHTGMIVTSTEPGLPDTVGITSTVAIRLRDVANDNTVVMSEATRQLVAGYFHLSTLGLHGLKDIHQPVQVYLAELESGAQTRLEAAEHLTTLVGREKEIALLAKWWEEARQGRDRTVLLRGEAGIGKSRLVLALKQHVGNAPCSVRELRCFPEFSNTPFHPFIALLESVMGFAPTDTPGIRLEKLARFLDARQARTDHEAALLAQFLSLPYAAPALAPQQQKEMILNLLLGLLDGLATQQPVLVVFEDLHWADPSSLELFSLLAQRREALPMLVLATARPSFRPPWDEGELATLDLPPLNDADMTAMIGLLGAEITPELAEHIVARADGIPLFAEEMTRMTLRAGIDATPVPATLRDLLAARLDVIGEAKRSAQLAAAIGREFDLDLLRLSTTLDQDILARDLAALRGAGLVLDVAKTPHTVRFKHALIQEAAYQSQPRSTRQATHRCIAKALGEHFPELANGKPEVLAQHLSAGGEPLAAIPYLIQAGQRAARQSAYPEAERHFSEGLNLLMDLPQNSARDGLEFALQVELGASLQALEGYASSRSGQAFARALELRGREGTGLESLQSLRGLHLNLSGSGKVTEAFDIASKMVRLAQRDASPVDLIDPLALAGFSALLAGALDEARRYTEQAEALYSPEYHQVLVARFGEDGGTIGRLVLAWTNWLLGYPERAERGIHVALSMAQRQSHPRTLAVALSMATNVAADLGKIETAKQLAEELIALASRYGLLLQAKVGAIFGAWARTMAGHPNAHEHLEVCHQELRPIHAGSAVLFTHFMADAYLRCGEPTKAMATATWGTAAASEYETHLYDAEVLRLRGEALLALAPDACAEAETCFDEALSISRRQQAKSLELRAAMSMARLWRNQGREKDAKRLLGEVHAWFTEGFSTPDLTQARELLERLDA